MTRHEIRMGEALTDELLDMHHKPQRIQPVIPERGKPAQVQTICSLCSKWFRSGEPVEYCEQAEMDRRAADIEAAMARVEEMSMPR